MREGVARQGPSALNLHRVQDSWCTGQWASQENQLWDPHPFPNVCTHSLQGTLGLQEERQKGCSELLFPPATRREWDSLLGRTTGSEPGAHPCL